MNWKKILRLYLGHMAVSGEPARITKRGRLVAWLSPPTPGELRREELIAEGKLLPGPAGGLAGWKPLPAEVGPTLSESLAALRDDEDR
ncbi:MAG: hypothetical protein ACRDPW_01630 [Mycobacteriales bacterium]